ncbi:hypothetical protein ABBQ32_000928 [Trebouxia sp. C0010 RCD-2024]
MVLGTVSATDVTSQPLRSQPSADDVGVTISSKRNGPKAAARVLMVRTLSDGEMSIPFRQAAVKDARRT